MAKKKNIESLSDSNTPVERINVSENDTTDAVIVEESIQPLDQSKNETEEGDVVFSQNYFESEILFKLKSPNPNMAEIFDFTDALIDLNFITGIERAVLSRLEELGLTTQEQRQEYNTPPDIHPFVYSNAYPDGVLVLGVTYDELKTMLVKFKS